VIHAGTFTLCGWTKTNHLFVQQLATLFIFSLSLVLASPSYNAQSCVGLSKKKFTISQGSPHNANHIITSYCYLPVSCRNLVDHCGSFGSFNPISTSDCHDICEGYQERCFSSLDSRWISVIFLFYMSAHFHPFIFHPFARKVWTLSYWHQYYHY
jgi:hypothetical protein